MKRFLPTLTLVATQIGASAALIENPYLHTFTRGATLELEVCERPSAPFYRPPHSPVSYAVRFEDPVAPESLSVQRADGSPIAFQLSAVRKDDTGNLAFARLHFGASPGDSFRVTSDAKATSPGRPAFSWQDNDSHFVLAGDQVVGIPKGGAVEDAAGPIASLAFGDRVLPKITILAGKRKLESITTRRVSRGSIFTEFLVTYTFDNGATYEATVGVSPQLPFVTLDESIEGLTGEDGVTAELRLEGFELREGDRRRVGPGNPELTLDSPGVSLAVFAMEAPSWTDGAPPLVLRDSKATAGAVLAWPLSAPPGATSSRRIGLSLHSPEFGLAKIANHPPGRTPRSTDTFASWLYHYYSRVPLDATKDWLLEHETVRPPRLFNAYRIARVRLEHQYPLLAKIAAEAAGHPLAREWAAQASSIISRHDGHAAAAGHDHAHGHADLGRFSIEAHPHEDGSHVAMTSDGYRVVIETVDEGNATLSFPGEGPDAQNVLVATAGETSVGIDGSLEHAARGQRAVAVVGASSLNGTPAGPNFRPGVGIREAAGELPLRIGVGEREDLVFFGDAESGRLKTDGEGFAFDGEFGIASGDALALFSAGGEETVSNRIASPGLTLSTEGVGVSASFVATGAREGGADQPVEGLGMFNAPHGGKLRLRFAPPEPAIYRPRGSLMAFWRFDEAEGRSVANAKAPALPAQVVGGVAGPERIRGVGFDKVYALVLDPSAHVETFFDVPLPEEHTVCVWVKTEVPGSVWSKALGSGRRFAPGSRWLHIDDDGDAIATVATKGGVVTLRGNAELLDGEWHHLAWIVEGDSQRLLINGEPVARAPAVPHPAPAAPMRLGGATTIPDSAGNPAALPGFDGAMDNVRVYDMALRDHEVAGIRTVGVRRAPIVITSTPATELFAGETFNYDIEFTGAPYVQFRFAGLPEWISFQGRLTGTPGLQHIGETENIFITGLCPWGPAQQQFKIKVKPPLVGEDWGAYIGGKPVETRRLGYGVEFDLPEGAGQFEFTNKAPLPQTTEVLKAIESPDGLEVRLRAAGGATQYEVRISPAGSGDWSQLATGEEPTLTAALPGPGDYVLVATAKNAGRAGSLSRAFPISVTHREPQPPGAPELELADGEVTLCWEPVAGASGYTVHRRNLTGEGGWKVIHSGEGTHFTDAAAKGVVPRFDPPGLRANVGRDLSAITVYEYSISASNGHGDSERGAAACTDPRGW